MTSEAQLGSSTSLCDFVLEHQLLQLKPSSVVDFGAGGGKNGRLVRRVLPDVKLTAVEGYEPACAALRNGGIYSDVWSGLIQDWVSQGSERYSVAIFGDVLEHLKPGEIHDVLRACLHKFDHIIIVVPLHDIFQDDSYGNKLEIHKSYVTEHFFDRYHPTEKHIVEGSYTIMCLLISTRRQRKPLFNRIAWNVFHASMLALQPLGLARPLVDLLKLTPIKKIRR